MSTMLSSPLTFPMGTSLVKLHRRPSETFESAHKNTKIVCYVDDLPAGVSRCWSSHMQRVVFSQLNRCTFFLFGFLET